MAEKENVSDKTGAHFVPWGDSEKGPGRDLGKAPKSKGTMDVSGAKATSQKGPAGDESVSG